jgi:hypothetical protein
MTDAHTLPDHASRDEFSIASPALERSVNEHPEQAYRRGYQQGAYAIVKALKETGAIEGRILAVIEDHVNLKLANWRYSRTRRLKRNIIRDDPPALQIKCRQNGARGCRRRRRAVARSLKA